MHNKLRILVERIVTTKEIFQEKIAHVHGESAVRVPILMYHHIAIPNKNEKKVQLYVDPELFNCEMSYLRENSFTTITLDDLRNALNNKSKLPHKSIILTFDDGDLDFYTNAFPVLKKYNLKATLFVVTSWIGKKKYVTWGMLRIMNKSSLVTIGSHTVTHSNLLKSSTDKVQNELIQSKKILENKLNILISTFAYPYGSYDGNVSEAITKAKYLTAVTTKYGSLHREYNLLCMKRIRIGNQLSDIDFQRRVNRK